MNTQSPASKAGAYIYCIMPAAAFRDGTPDWRSPGIGGRGDALHLVQFGELVALVSDSPAERYDIGRANTMAHQVALEEAMKHSEVLPVRFSTVAKSDDDIREKLLKRRYGELIYLLRTVQGRSEQGLKVFWNRERLFAAIAASDQRVRTLRDAMAGQSPEESHYQRIQLGQATEEALTRQRDEDAEMILTALRPLAIETKTNKILTDMMVLNAAFLVENAHEAELDAAVNQLDEANAGRLLFKYVGPVPPYNFVNIVVRWED